MPHRDTYSPILIGIAVNRALIPIVWFCDAAPLHPFAFGTDKDHPCTTQNQTKRERIVPTSTPSQNAAPGAIVMHHPEPDKKGKNYPNEYPFAKCFTRGNSIWWHRIMFSRALLFFELDELFFRGQWDFGHTLYPLNDPALKTYSSGTISLFFIRGWTRALIFIVRMKVLPHAGI